MNVNLRQLKELRAGAERIEVKILNGTEKQKPISVKFPANGAGIYFQSFPLEQPLGGDGSTNGLKPSKNIRRTGTKWLFYGEGYIASTRLVILERNVFLKTEKRFINTQYLVKDPGQLTVVRTWLAKNISPLLNTDRRDNAMEATIVPWALGIYASDDDKEEARLLYLPMADIFPGFSEENFQSLLKDWHAVEVKE